MTFDPTKPVQTIDGRKARIICTDRRHSSGTTIVALVESSAALPGEEVMRSYFASGRQRHDVPGPHDLINVPEEHEIWLNVFHDDAREIYKVSVHQEHDAAYVCRGVGRIACLGPIKFKVGEGLE